MRSPGVVRWPQLHHQQPDRQRRLTRHLRARPVRAGGGGGCRRRARTRPYRQLGAMSTTSSLPCPFSLATRCSTACRPISCAGMATDVSRTEAWWRPGPGRSRSPTRPRVRPGPAGAAVRAAARPRTRSARRTRGARALVEDQGEGQGHRVVAALARPVQHPRPNSRDGSGVRRGCARRSRCAARFGLRRAVRGASGAGCRGHRGRFRGGGPRAPSGRSLVPWSSWPPSRSEPAQNRATAGRQLVHEGVGEQVVSGFRQGHGFGAVVDQELPAAAVRGACGWSASTCGRQSRHLGAHSGLRRAAGRPGRRSRRRRGGSRGTSPARCRNGAGSAPGLPPSIPWA